MNQQIEQEPGRLLFTIGMTMRFLQQIPQDRLQVHLPDAVRQDGDREVRDDGEEGTDFRFHPSAAPGVPHRDEGRADHGHAAADTDFRFRLSGVPDGLRVLRLFQRLFLRFR